jgi:hypothetical protein
MPNHDGRPSLRSVASSSILLYTACILGGAGTGPGRECAALMSDLSVGDSLDIVYNYFRNQLFKKEYQLNKGDGGEDGSESIGYKAKEHGIGDVYEL